MFRRHIDNVFAKFIFSLDQKIELYFTIFSFDNRSYKRFSLTIVDILKFLNVKLSEKSIISLNDDTKNKIYLNVKLLENLISLFNNLIDEILATIKHFVVEIDYFFEYMKLSKIEKIKQIQFEYLKIVKRAQNAIEKIIKTIRKVVQKMSTNSLLCMMRLLIKLSR